MLKSQLIHERTEFNDSFSDNSAAFTSHKSFIVKNNHKTEQEIPLLQCHYYAIHVFHFNAALTIPAPFPFLSKDWS